MEINIDAIIKKAVAAGIKAGMDCKERDYFREVEKLLYSYNALKTKVEMDKKDIRDLRKEKFNKTTWHDMSNVTNANPEIDDEIRHLQKIRSRERSMKRTMIEIERIDKALKQIEHDPSYCFIKMYYFDGMQMEVICEQYNYTQRHVRRIRQKLIGKLQIILFGADALN